MAKQKKLDSRAKAAKGLKGKEPAGPPEEDMGGMPPPDMGGGMPQGMDEMPPPDMGGGMPPEMAGLMGGVGMEQGPPPEPTVEDSLMAVEAALGDLPPELAEEARTHINAIREIVANAGGGAEPSPAELPAPGAAPMPDQELPPV